MSVWQRSRLSEPFHSCNTFICQQHLVAEEWDCSSIFTVNTWCFFELLFCRINNYFRKNKCEKEQLKKMVQSRLDDPLSKNRWKNKSKFFHLLFVEFLELVLLRFYLRMNTIEEEQLKRCGSKGTAEQKWINQDWMTSFHLNHFIFRQAVAWCQKIFFVI